MHNVANAAITNRHEWYRQVQRTVDDIDQCIERRDDDGLTLKALA